MFLVNLFSYLVNLSFTILKQELNFLKTDNTPLNAGHMAPTHIMSKFYHKEKLCNNV